MKMGHRRKLLKVLTALTFLLVFCEYLIHYIVLSQCKWPALDPRNVDPTILDSTKQETPVYAMFITDIHLMGSQESYWLDKYLREWQMYRTFQILIKIHKPEVIFILGDTFDEGKWCSRVEFDNYITRFRSLFHVSENTQLYVVAGNHDMGFHYAITPYLNERYINGMKMPNVEKVSLRGNHFILINSMGLEGDSCFICKPTEIALNKIAEQLNCINNMTQNCVGKNSIKRYSRPILLQHYPMYRESDEFCHEPDEAPPDVKVEKFKDKWDCLSKEASMQLIDTFNPRLIVNGHVHHGCTVKHKNGIVEITMSSFNWHNKDNPSILLGVLSPNNYSTSKCYMVVESTVIKIYVFSIASIIIYLIIRSKITSKCRPRIGSLEGGFLDPKRSLLPSNALL